MVRPPRPPSGVGWPIVAGKGGRARGYSRKPQKPPPQARLRADSGHLFIVSRWVAAWMAAAIIVLANPLPCAASSVEF